MTSNLLQNDMVMILAALLLVDVVLIILGNRKHAVLKSIPNWTKIKGEIERRVNINRGATGGNLFIVTFQILYKYQVKGIEYKNFQYCSPNDMANTQEELDSIVNGKFKEGTEIDVYVNPDNPKESTFRLDLPPYHQYYWGSAAGLTALTLLILWLTKTV